MDDKPAQTFTFDKDFHEIVNNKEVLKRTTEKFLNNLIDDLTLGIIFDAHRKFKTKAFNLDRDYAQGEADDATAPPAEIFDSNAKKGHEIVYVTCPNCDRSVGASKFAPHLHKCLSMGRMRSRNMRRAVNNNKDRDSSPYYGFGSDDDEEAESDKRRQKKKDRNGGKKNKSEECNDLSAYRDLLQDHSNGSSPIDSSSSSSTTSSKKREKTKNKKSHKRDRTSPSVSSNAD